MSRSGGSSGNAFPFFALFASIILVAGGIPLSGEGSSSGNIPSREFTIDGCNVTGLVYIDGNAGLAGVVDRLGGSGKGTIDEPYHIEGIHFRNDQENYMAIEIRNIDKHLIFRKCIIAFEKYDQDYHGYYHNIFFYNLKNFTMCECTIENGVNGMRISSSSVILRGNTIQNNIYDGVTIIDSSGIVERNIICGNGKYGIVFDSPDTVLVNNTLAYNAILTYESIPDSNTINGKPILLIKDNVNETYSGDYSQVIIINSTNTVLKDMKFYNVSVGILMAERELDNMPSHNTLIRNCEFTGCGIGIYALNDTFVESCIFEGCKKGVEVHQYYYYYFNEDLFFECHNNTFEGNEIGIQADYFSNISNNIFNLNKEYGINIEFRNRLGPLSLVGNNVIMNTTGSAIRIISYFDDCPTLLLDNTIIGAQVGIWASGIVNLTGNKIIDCLELSIVLHEGSYIIMDNTIIGLGISCISYCDTYVDQREHRNTINGLPLIFKVAEKDITIDSPFGQMFLIYCRNINILNATTLTLPHATIMERCEGAEIANCTISSLQVTDSKMIVLRSNNFTHCALYGCDSDLSVYGNNFWDRVLALSESWEYSTVIDFKAWDNYYSDYFNIYNYSYGYSSKDGIHWDQEYQFWLYVDSIPRIFPIGYSGSRVPVYINISAPGDVDEGSIINISAEVWDFHRVVNVTVVIWIGSTLWSQEKMIRGIGYNWSYNKSVPYNITSMAFSLHAISLAGFWTNTTNRTVIVNDVLPPSIVDRSDKFGYTGNEFKFKAGIVDNRDLYRAYIEFFRTGTANNTLELDLEHMEETIVLPSNRDDPLYYRIIAVDATGNEASTSLTTIIVEDDDKPEVKVPPLVYAFVGENVTFDGTMCKDNVGIADYTWSFFETIRRDVYGETPVYQFRHPGKYQVTLTVKDHAGNWDKAVMLVNVSEKPSPPLPPPETVYVRAVIGPVLDNGTNEAVKDVKVIIALDGKSYTNYTLRDGYAILLLPQPDDEMTVAIVLLKTGYHAMTFSTILYPDGSFRDSPPRMIRIESGPPNNDPGDSEDRKNSPWPYVMAVLLVTSIVLIILIWALLRRRTGTSEE